jgi:hypothetical protein
MRNELNGGSCKMKISPFSKHIFYAYQADADLPDPLIIQEVALKGELEDLLMLRKCYPSDQIKNEVKKFRQQDPKRVHFILKVLLDG